SGTIAITGDAKNFAILNTQFFFTDSLGNSNVAAHGVDTVQGQSIAIGVPEPTGLGVMAIASLGMLRRRRR
ncbi:MAG: hypothetical protein JWL69_4396, partial [Phycisphaerales bacterium]|nr:hypothetical protein [Phycisphaerales bacterium]